VLVGEDPASQVYVSNKVKTCGELGMTSRKIELPAETSQAELMQVVHELNADAAIHGILVQSPLPGELDEDEVVRAIDPRKDVDGFHPMNVGRLTVDEPCFRSCTPAGIMELFKYYSIPVKAKHAVVVGASNIVGSPMAIMLSRENASGKATTTICHKFTKDLTQHTISADIVIAAAGQPHLIKAEMIKEGAVVIDVGINRVADETSDKGYKLVGDVDFESVRKKASWITPVPGGVGPMTVAMLMKNTLLAAKNSIYPE
jgi:methylenetetrahydrofolate dehydrogenase (NADP+)/methenyltetrahydrofolate cyclohydrolase